MSARILLGLLGVGLAGCSPSEWKQVLREDCQAGLSRACLRLGEREEQGEDSQGPVRAREAYAAGCALGDLEACFRKTVLEQESPESPLRETLLGQFRKSCDGGFPEACQRAAEVADVMNDHDAARALYQRACESDVQRACASADRVLRQKADVPRSTGESKDSGGGLDREVIGEVIRAKNKQVSHCFRKHMPIALSRLRLRIHWMIRPDGTVGATRVLEAITGGEPTYACVLDLVDGMLFPAPKGGGSVSVTFPWLFNRFEEATGETR